MKNMQIAGTGNSRWMKSAIPETATWEEVRGLLRSGTFPFDLNGLNEAGILERGTPYNVESVLRDATAAFFGGDNSMVLDDALRILKSLVDAAKTTAEGRARVQVGTYAGNGKVGSGNKKSLTFSFPVQFFILHDGSNALYTQYSGANGSNGINQKSYLLIPRLTAETDIKMFGYGDPNYQIYNKFLFSGNNVSWYAYSSDAQYHPADAGYQFNASGKTYYYIGIG